MAFGQPRIEYKTNAQMRMMHEAGLVLSRALDAAVAAAAPGVTTEDLDGVFAAVLQRGGSQVQLPGLPRLPGHHLHLGERGSGARHPRRPGPAGRGHHLDRRRRHRGRLALRLRPHRDRRRHARDPEDQRLSDVTEEAMWRGIAALATGKFVGDIGNAIDDYVSSVPGKPLGILEDYVGHGIGSADAHGPGRAELPHQPPRPQDPARPVPGHRAHAGPRQHRNQACSDDDWTVVTTERQALVPVGALRGRAREGHLGLSAPDGGAAQLAPARRRARPDSRRAEWPTPTREITPR